MHQNDCTDIDLWDRIRRDDRAAFDLVYQRYADILFSSIYQHIDNRQDAEDILQETFLTMWEKRQSIVLTGKLFSYLFRVARNRVIAYLKNRSVTPRLLDEFNAVRAEASHVASPAVFREREILEAEGALEKAIEALPDRMKKIYEMSLEKGLTIAEIAAALLVSPNTVKNQLAVVRKRLKGALHQLSSWLFILLF